MQVLQPWSGNAVGVNQQRAQRATGNSKRIIQAALILGQALPVPLLYLRGMM